MIKKLQKRFVIFSTGIIFFILIFLSLSNAVLNLVALKSESENLSKQIITNYLNNDFGPQDFHPGPPDDLKRSRFLIVELQDDDFSIVKNSFLDFLNETNLSETIEKINGKKKESGIIDNFSYTLFAKDDKQLVLLLDILDYKQVVVFIFFLLSFISLIIVLFTFILTSIVSKRVVKPFADNIEKQKRFITDASHELKTPVTSITTSAEVLAMSGQNNEWLENIQNQSKRLTKLINEMISLSSFDEEKIKLNRQLICLSDISWGIMEPYKKQAELKNIRFLQEVEEDLYFKCDENSLNKLINILLENAVKYTNENGEIRYHLYKNRNNIFIEVFNTCDYIPDESLKLLFDRFYRVDNSRNSKTGGNGIGLAIAKTICEKNDFKIDVTTKTNYDILFKIKIK